MPLHLPSVANPPAVSASGPDEAVSHRRCCRLTTFFIWLALTGLYLSAPAAAQTQTTTPVWQWTESREGGSAQWGLTVNPNATDGSEAQFNFQRQWSEQLKLNFSIESDSQQSSRPANSFAASPSLPGSSWQWNSLRNLQLQWDVTSGLQLRLVNRASLNLNPARLSTTQNAWNGFESSARLWRGFSVDTVVGTGSQTDEEGENAWTEEVRVRLRQGLLANRLGLLFTPSIARRYFSGSDSGFYTDQAVASGWEWLLNPRLNWSAQVRHFDRLDAQRQILRQTQRADTTLKSKGLEWGQWHLKGGYETTEYQVDESTASLFSEGGLNLKPDANFDLHLFSRYRRLLDGAASTNTVREREMEFQIAPVWKMSDGFRTQFNYQINLGQDPARHWSIIENSFFINLGKRF